MKSKTEIEMQSKPETLLSIETRNLNEIETRNPQSNRNRDLNEIETRNPTSDPNQKYYMHSKPGFGLGKLSHHRGGSGGLVPGFGFGLGK